MTRPILGFLRNLLFAFAPLLAAATTRGALANPVSHPVVVGYERFFRNQKDDAVEAGRLLLSELGCINCHVPDSESSPPFRFTEAPRLAGLAERVRPGFLHQWLEHPNTLKPGTAMPDLLDRLSDSQRTSTIHALEQFLLSLPVLSAQTPPATDDPLNRARGRELYHAIGCAACHPADPGVGFLNRTINQIESESSSFTPLPKLSEKYSPTSLAMFLMDPLKTRPSGRMPRIPLTATESLNIAAYLIGDSRAAVEENRLDSLDPIAVKAGSEQFRRLGCAACHRVTIDGAPLRPLLTVPAMNQLSGGSRVGCLSPTPSVGLPNYRLDPDQRAAISVALKSLGNAQSLSATEKLDRQLVALNCFACHRRNGRGGPTPESDSYFQSSGEDLGDEGRLPPDLTGVGGKLTSNVIARILAGDGAVRPYMAVRMPDYGTDHAQTLASLFERCDLRGNTRPTPRDGNENQVGRNAWGRSLMSVSGLNCIACHNLNGVKSLGISVLDLAHAPHRLRPEWFRDYLIDPTKFRPGTRMPSFWPDGKPLLPGFGGATDRQIDSIWVYLNEIDQSRLPEGLELKGQFRLIPNEHPIVFRTFMKGVGMHAVAVGFPQGVHAAFDAKQCRWALAWKGDFLDAESTWDDRFTPLTPPLGRDIIVLESQPSIARLPEWNAPWSSASRPTAKGYRLDDAGIPTFRYRIVGVTVEDRVHPNAAGTGLIRSLRLDGRQNGLVIRVAAASSITPLPNQTWRLSDGKTISMRHPETLRPILSTIVGSQELRLTLDLEDSPLEVEWEILW